MKVILKSKVGKAVYRISVGDEKTPRVLEFLEKNNFQAEVPTEISYKDGFGNKHIVQENWAQHLLNSYPDALEIVEEVATPVVTAPKITSKKGK